MNVLYFPQNLSIFPNVFLRMQFTGRTLEERKKGVYSTIYLPLPESDFFQKQIQLDYSTEDLGISGEFAKRNADSILTGLSKTLGSINTYFEGFEDNMKTLSSAISRTGAQGAIKTGIERFVMGTGESNAVKAVTQGLGYGAAPNSTQMFKALNIRDTVTLKWEFKPKNYKEGKEIEKIYKEILKLSLPYLKEEHLTKTGKKYFSTPAPSVKSGKTSDNDAWFKDSKWSLKDFEKSQQYYSTTFELPYKVKIDVMKMEDDRYNSSGRGLQESQITVAKELISFPIDFVVAVIDMEFIKPSDESETVLIEYEGEYFSQNYMMYMALREERLIRNTGDDRSDVIDHSQDMRG